VCTSAYLLHYIKALASYTILPPIILRWLLLKVFDLPPLKGGQGGHLRDYGRLSRSLYPSVNLLIAVLLNLRLLLVTDPVYLSLVQTVKFASTLEYYLLVWLISLI
jgi:hypothetical protein